MDKLIKTFILFLSALYFAYSWQNCPVTFEEVINNTDLLNKLLFSFTIFIALLCLVPSIMEYFYKKCSWFKEFIDYSISKKKKDG